MRNLKKILALVLALVMALSVMSVASAKKLGEYTDAASVSKDYETAVDVVTQLGVLEGDVGFRPQDSLTRAEMAAIIYRITTGDVDDDYTSNFVAGAAANYSDVTIEHWAAGYIGYCTDAGFLEGWSGKFWPGETMTGYQALVALLRAIGYDQPNQFSNSDWTVQAARFARVAGVSEGVYTDLNKAITREQFAMFIYNALFANKVRYTLNTGYEEIASTLAYEVFDIVSPKWGEVGDDTWGRPSTVWKNIYGQNAVSIAETPVATYYTMIDECEIAHDLGDSSFGIEAAFIDGERYDVTDPDVARDGEGDINVYDTTSMVGANGRITEVYEMAPAGPTRQLRLVEINTYLAQVSAIVPETVDKNGHKQAPYSILTVYVPEKTEADLTTGDPRDDGILFDTDNTASQNRAITMKAATTEFPVGSYVLVTENDDTRSTDYVASIKAATTGATGAVTGYTLGSDNWWTGTTTLGTTLYNDADKFIYISGNVKPEGTDNKTLDAYKSDALADKTVYTAVLDEYGNLIGLAPVGTNYLVIEAVRWIGDSTLYGGKAVADVVLADGTRVQNVTIASVHGVTAAHNGRTDVDPQKATFDTSYADNSDYYNHIVTYTVNPDGTYAIGTIVYHDNDKAGIATTVATDLTADQGVVITGQTVVYEDSDGDENVASNGTPKFAVNDNTVFLLKNQAPVGNGYSYTVYVGKDNVPTLYNADICYVVPTATYPYSSLVVVDDYQLVDGNKFVAYVDATYTAANRVDIGGTAYYAHLVWKLGEATPTVVYEADAQLGGNVTTIGSGKNGLFELTLDANGVIQSATEAIEEDDASTPAYDNNNSTLVGNYLWDGTTVTANDGMTMYKTNTNEQTWWVNNAKYIQVNTNDQGIVTGVREVAFNQIDWYNGSNGQVVLVGYTQVNATSPKLADYVYILNTSTAPAPGKTYELHTTQAGDTDTTAVTVEIDVTTGTVKVNSGNLFLHEKDSTTAKAATNLQFTYEITTWNPSINDWNQAQTVQSTKQSTVAVDTDLSTVSSATYYIGEAGLNCIVKVTITCDEGTWTFNTVAATVAS